MILERNGVGKAASATARGDLLFDVFELAISVLGPRELPIANEPPERPGNVIRLYDAREGISRILDDRSYGPRLREIPAPYEFIESGCRARPGSNTSLAASVLIGSTTAPARCAFTPPRTFPGRH